MDAKTDPRNLPSDPEQWDMLVRLIGPMADQCIETGANRAFVKNIKVLILNMDALLPPEV